MLSDKEQKKKFKKVASQDPEKYYPTSVLNDKGFMRKQCKSCGTYFWTTHEDRDVCGDPACSGGFDVVEDNPSENRLSFIGVWKKIVEILEPRGYKPINRYPVVARWNPTTEFTIASIAAFQPYVITGEVPPPAKKIIIPQFCLRFGDIENVGITGAHNCGFVMIGQHVFVSPDEWEQDAYFKDIYDFLIDGVGLSKHEVTIHEDAWAGGGSYGPCLEFFSRGVELFNQVYTMYEQTPHGDRELKLKVLDMGLGQERVAWFSQGTPNIYEAIFPEVLAKLKKTTQVEQDLKLYKRFSKYSAYLNVDEVDDLDEAWQRVADELNMEVDELQDTIMPMTGLYSIAEHSRALLFAISDGKLPSNVGGGYNLRVIFRRAVSFADQFGWDIDLSEVCKWHAEELKDIFPEVSEHLNEVKDVLDVEYEKYYATKKKAKKIVKNLIEKDEITEEMLLQLYDSNGINPEMVVETARKMGKKIKKPDNFYSKVVALHEQREQLHQTHIELDLEIPPDIKGTKIDYYDDYLKLEEDAKVVYIEKAKVEGEQVWAVITDRTIAYPTSGGQLHDIGSINGMKFNDVRKFSNYVVHLLDKKPDFDTGDTVKIKVQEDWRRQLAAHHTATHVINAAARQVLGEHVNQASAKKTYEKAHLDITHYENLSDEEIIKIENRANQMIEESLPIQSYLMPRTEAEQKYGMRLYQGGAVPGKKLRIVQIEEEDVEACGGTHMHNTDEIERIKIINVQKIQDGIVRLTFTGGNAVDRLDQDNKHLLEEFSEILGVEPPQLLPRIQEIFRKTKKLKKALTKGQEPKEELQKLTSDKVIAGSSFHLIERLTDFLQTGSEKLASVLQKHLDEYSRLVRLTKEKTPDLEVEDEVKPLTDDYDMLIKRYSGLNQKEVIQIAQNILKENQNLFFVAFIENKNGFAVTAFIGSKVEENLDINFSNIMQEILTEFGGKGGGRSNNFQGFAPIAESEKESFIESFENKFESSVLKKIS